MRPITKIYIHCSYSEWGSVDIIRKWHTDLPPEGNGWSDIGYHYVVHNQFIDFETFKKIADACADEHGKFSDRLYSTSTDGKIVKGRPLSIRGAHVKGDNSCSIGVCYIGITPTVAQYNAMLYLCKSLMLKHRLINVENVRGHGETDIKKTCPNFNMESFRFQLADIMKVV